MFKSHQLYSNSSNVTRKFLSNNNRTTSLAFPLVVNTTASFSSVGDNNWVVPAGVVAIRAYMWGAGGTAGNASSGGAGGGNGGGAGSLNGFIMQVTPGETLTFRIGQSYPLTNSNGSTSNGNVTATGGGGFGGNGDGAGANGAYGSPGGGASSILRSGVFIAWAAGGGGGGGSGYPGPTQGGDGGAGGAGTAAGGAASGSSPNPAQAGGSGSSGGGGGGGGGSGSSYSTGAGQGGQGGSNFMSSQPSAILGTPVVAGTSINGSGQTAANTGSPFYVPGVGTGGTRQPNTGNPLNGGNGYIYIEALSQQT